MIGQILITGASSGIGREISIKLSEIGYKCVLTGRSLSRLENTLEKMSGNSHQIFAGDLNDHSFIDKISNEIGDKGVSENEMIRMRVLN